eukprot:COSAG02_NODE_7395_length_3036_cov_1.262853_3_plen_65_part_00
MMVAAMGTMVVLVRLMEADEADNQDEEDEVLAVEVAQGNNAVEVDTQTKQCRLRLECLRILLQF